MPKAPQSDSQLDRPSRSDHIRYRIDLFMSWNPMARFIGLFVVSFVLIALCAGLAMLVSDHDANQSKNIFDAMWWSMMRVIDAGAMAEDSGTWVRVVAVLATLSGIMVVALLIGLVSSTIGEKIEELREGKSPVIDSNHTLILGFGAKVFPILRELREANSNQKHATIVILSATNKQEVEDQVREQMGDMRTTRVIVRQGEQFSVHDLRKVGAGRARSIIVLAKGDGAVTDESQGNADMDTIKTLLALRRIPGALKHNHAVVEIIESHRAEVVQQLGQGGVEVVAMRETLARLMVQTARQTGLASVYKNLLSYSGSELYFKSFPELDGWRYDDIPSVLKGAVLMGVRQGVGTATAKTRLNPPIDTKISSSDELLVLAEDDDAFSVDFTNRVITPAIPMQNTRVLESKPERIFVAGYRSDLVQVIGEFDKYVQPGAKIFCMAGDQDEVFGSSLAEGLPMRNLSVERLQGDPTDPKSLARIKGLGITAALLVADDTGEQDEADACTVITLLLLREMFKDIAPGQRPRVISEILDPRTQELVTADDLTDFVVSSEITSMLLAQISERRELNGVFADLFDADGSEIYLKTMARYVPIGQSVSWLAVQQAARALGETAIGCFRPGIPPVLNPSQERPLVFRATDKLIVIAEDDGEGALPAHKAA